MTDWTGIAGIIGTLLGAALGAFITWQVQQLQLEHDNRTRFHSRRLEVYATFNDACQRVVAAAGLQYRDDPAFNEFTKTYETLRLVAGPGVIAAATPVHSSVLGAYQDRAISPDASTAYNRQMASLCGVMRSEIGV